MEKQSLDSRIDKHYFVKKNKKTETLYSGKYFSTNSLTEVDKRLMEEAERGMEDNRRFI